MISFIEQHATGKKVLFFFIFNLIMMMGVMPYCAKTLEKIAGPVTVIDLQPPIYASSTMTEVLTQLGEEGRAKYKQIEVIADSIYPIGYAIAYALLICWLLGKTNLRTGWKRYLPLVPIMGAGFDFLENFGIISAINSFPALGSYSQLTPYFSLFKWIGAVGGILTVLILFVVWVIKRFIKNI